MALAQNQNWFADRGDETRALDWPLDENSHVWEIGGFEGRWAAQIVDKFNCYVDIFEPQTWAVQRMEERFRENEKVTIHPYGLWILDDWLPMGDYFTDGCSLMKAENGDSGMREFRDFHKELQGFEKIDLCLMNIEGAEYVLLPAMCISGDMARFDRFWCQFHPGLVNYSESQTPWIYAGIEKTHNRIWDYFPTAVAWEKRDL